MASPIAGVSYIYDSVAKAWVAPGRPSLPGTSSTSDVYVDTYSDTY